MAINSIREDLPKNQAQEGALKDLSSSEKDLKKNREIMLKGCFCRNDREVTSANNPATGPEQGKPPQIKYNSRLAWLYS